jgi:hypothetical protein
MRFCPKCSRVCETDKRICRACGGILEELPEAEAVGRMGAAKAPREADFIPLAEPVEKPVRPRPPLGLPAGSVRALLTLLVIGVVVVQLVRDQAVELLWTETLMIALAHYFTSRRLIKLSPDLVRRLTDEGHLEADAQPLYLPRNSIRVIICLAFVGVAVYLWDHGTLWQPQPLTLLGVVFAYLFGIVTRATAAGWEDFKAGIVLALMVFAAAAYLLGQPELLPSPLRTATLALALYYFGSR